MQADTLTQAACWQGRGLPQVAGQAAQRGQGHAHRQQVPLAGQEERLADVRVADACSGCSLVLQAPSVVAPATFSARGGTL